MRQSSPAVDQVYQRLAAVFETAYNNAQGEDLTLQIGNSVARLRATTPALQSQLQRPLACPRLAPGVTPHFSIDFVDLGEAALPPLPWAPQHVSPEQETSEYKEGPYVFTRHGDVLLTALDQESRRSVGLVHAPARWPLRHYKQAIFITLYQHLRRAGLHLIHASAIASHGRAVLIAGQSGAGKTTTMLTCVAAGFEFLGDDSTLIQRTPAGDIDVVALMSTLDVTDNTAAWFPQLTPHLSAQRSHTGKRQVILSEAFPDRIAHRGRVRVLLAPEIADQQHTSVVPISKAALLRDLLFYSVDLHDAALTRQHFEFLVQTVEQAPSYRLLLGRDRTQIPQVIEELLSDYPSEGLETGVLEINGSP